MTTKLVVVKDPENFRISDCAGGSVYNITANLREDLPTWATLALVVDHVEFPIVARQVLTEILYILEVDNVIVTCVPDNPAWCTLLNCLGATFVSSQELKDGKIEMCKTSVPGTRLDSGISIPGDVPWLK
jgi:hypothetical protein